MILESFTHNGLGGDQSYVFTLMGMSGVGKTWLASLLPQQKWFHYSADYRIGTHYLNEDILDEIKLNMMQNSALKKLLRSDSIYVKQNLTFGNLEALSNYIGKFGSPQKGGLDRETFFYRQRRYSDAEKMSMRDLPIFIKRSRYLYGYQHFINDSSGSLCEIIDLDNPEDDILAVVKKYSLILYIEADSSIEDEIIKRQIATPKPMYYNRTLFEKFLKHYTKEHAVVAEDIDPDDFIRIFFPKVIAFRRERYRHIAEQHGHIIPAKKLAMVENEKDFLKLVNKL